jgi:hypothetical protein
VLNGKSPFMADRNHIHHRVLRLGYTHLQATLILSSIKILLIGTVLLFADLGNFDLIVLIFSISLLFNWGVTFFLRSKERESVSLRNLFI